MKEVHYSVVVNSEDQYSIWPEYKDIPVGWQASGTSGNREACLEWIEQNWLDLRPRSLRDRFSETL